MDRWNCGNMVLVPHRHCPGSVAGHCWSWHHSFWLTVWLNDRIINTYTSKQGAKLETVNHNPGLRELRCP